MKRKLVGTVTLLLIASLALAEELRPEPTQNPDATYRLFNTENIYTFLKMDTREGRCGKCNGETKITVSLCPSIKKRSYRGVGPTVASPGAI